MVVIAAVAANFGCFNVKVGSSSDKKGDSLANSGNKQSWRGTISDVAGKVFLGTEGGMVFYAFDTLAHPNEPVGLIARIQTVELQGLTGIKIGFSLDSELIDSALTDKDGFANIDWTPPVAGIYEFQVEVLEAPKKLYHELSEFGAIPLIVATHPKDHRLVVIDLDHTVVDSSFFRVLLGGGKPMADSVEVTERISQKYGIVYLTHRPDLMTHRSKSWLRKHGYPTGPLLVSQLRQVVGSSGKFKTAKLTELRAEFPNTRIGIGDKLSDAQAYVDNDMTAYLIPHYDPSDPDELVDMAGAISRLRGQGRLNVVTGWRQIERGIFEGETFPPEDFAKSLKDRADRLDSDDDDDDD